MGAKKIAYSRKQPGRVPNVLTHCVQILYFLLPFVLIRHVNTCFVSMKREEIQESGKIKDVKLLT